LSTASAPPAGIHLLVIVALLLGACGGGNARAPTPTKRANDRLDTLIAGARDEGELTLSWTPGFLDNPNELKGYIEGFNKLYGLNVRVRFASSSAFAEDEERLIADTQGGQVSFTDVFLGTEAEISALAKAVALSPEMWTAWAPNIGSLKLVAPGGIAVEVQSRIPGITYSTQRLIGADIPRSLADLLRSRYRGKIATTPDAATFDRLASPDVWGADRTVDFAKKLSPQLGGVIECGDEARVVRGDFDVFVFDCGSARVAQLKAEGALIGWSVPADAAFLRYLYMGVPKTAAHPSAARLWINFMLDRVAQDLMYQYGYADHYLIPGSRSFTEVDRATKAGVKFYEVTVEAVQSEDARGFKSAASQIQSVLRLSSRK
jgi:ABC-type Fe3+ transport system substrate-binding protein